MSLLIPKHNYIDDIKHRKWIANLPCIISGSDEVQAAHIRSGNKAGLGKKPSDDCIVPLSCTLHTEQHSMSEVKFWDRYGGIDKATALAKELYTVTGDNIEGLTAIARWRNG